jgi:hypothetical protein
MLATITPANAETDSKEKIAKPTLMIAFQYQWSSPLHQSHLPDHLPDQLSSEDEEDVESNPLPLARMTESALTVLLHTHVSANLDTLETTVKPTSMSAL